MLTPDILVVGLGAVGSATLYQAAKRGARVTGIDRFVPPHDQGSSHGDTRITRQAIGEGREFVPLVLRSHQIWREIEAETGRDFSPAMAVWFSPRPMFREIITARSRFCRTPSTRRRSSTSRTKFWQPTRFAGAILSLLFAATSLATSSPARDSFALRPVSKRNWNWPAALERRSSPRRPSQQ